MVSNSNELAPQWDSALDQVAVTGRGVIYLMYIMQEVRLRQKEMSPEPSIVVELEKENVSWTQQENAGFSLPDAALPYNLQPVSTASSEGETRLEACFQVAFNSGASCTACVCPTFPGGLFKAAGCARSSWQVQCACMCLMLQNHASALADIERPLARYRTSATLRLGIPLVVVVRLSHDIKCLMLQRICWRWQSSLEITLRAH